MKFVKGHGTENDFVLLPDPDDVLELTPAQTRALCDRHRGLGADGILRVVANSRFSASPVDPAEAEWFMDYRNADGSLAEMCGNGARVFALYLVENGLVDHKEFTIATRAGARKVIVHSDKTVTVDMGPVSVIGRAMAKLAGDEFPGLAIDVGNPHLACVINKDVAGLDLSIQPDYDLAVFPTGVNIEFVNAEGVGPLRMRVHERGVGETRSCGTGTVAAVAAVAHLAGKETATSIVTIPGGQVTVTIDEHTSTLTGPAEFVAGGEIHRSWWESVN